MACCVTKTEVLDSSNLKKRDGDEADIGKTGLAINLTGPDTPPVLAHVLPLAGGDLRTRLRPAAVAAVFRRRQRSDALSLYPRTSTACAKSAPPRPRWTDCDPRVTKPHSSRRILNP
jgi:hypothetical protein